MVFAVLGILSAALAVQYVLKARAQQRREAAFQLALKTYQDALPLPVTRQEVERYIVSRGEQFGRVCCVGNERMAFSDTVLIGKDDPPWFCGRNLVYLSFKFGPGKAPDSHLPSSDGSDPLRSIVVIHQFASCL